MSATRNILRSLHRIRTTILASLAGPPRLTWPFEDKREQAELERELYNRDLRRP